MLHQESTLCSTPPYPPGQCDPPDSHVCVLPAHPGQVLTYDIVSDEDHSKILLKLHLDVDDLHRSMFEAVHSGTFNYAAFLKRLAIPVRNEDARDRFYWVLSDYCQGELPQLDTDVWEAIVKGLVGGAS